jgi:signal transduction histidine kinase
VSDDGPGLGPDAAERLFLPHERGSAQGPGAGLGLAIARGIVRAHSGTICLEPTVKGTTVLVALPLEPDEACDSTDMSEPVDFGETVVSDGSHR